MPSSPHGGAQTVDNACDLLRLLARHGTAGARMLDLCQATGLARPTVHRMLVSLAAAGLVRQLADRRYALGPGLYELGLSAPSPVRAFPKVRKLIDDLARRTDDTAYLMLRSHEDVVCAWLAEGAYPIKASVLHLGSRRPLSASVAGLCILAGMGEKADEIVALNAPVLPHYCRMHEADVRRRIGQARAAGYAIGVEVVMEGVTAIGMAVPARYGAPHMAVSISAVSARIHGDRVSTLLRDLGATVKAIGDLAAGGAGASAV